MNEIYLRLRNAHACQGLRRPCLRRGGDFFFPQGWPLRFCRAVLCLRAEAVRAIRNWLSRRRRRLQRLEEWYRNLGRAGVWPLAAGLRVALRMWGLSRCLSAPALFPTW